MSKVDTATTSVEERDLSCALGKQRQKKSVLVSSKQPATLPTAAKAAKPWGDWGGFDDEFGGPWTTGFLTFFVPVIPYLLLHACTDYEECSVTAVVQDLVSGGDWTWRGLLEGIPPPSPTAWAGFGLFVAFQLFLYFILPGKRIVGQPTPAGNVLPYKINGACIMRAINV